MSGDAQRELSPSVHVMKHDEVVVSQARPAWQSADVLQQMFAVWSQQTPFMHCRRSAQLPRPVPVHASPRPGMATHALPVHVYPVAQSAGDAHVVAQDATGWVTFAVHVTGAYAPQSCTAPAHPESSAAGALPHTFAVQVASRRSPWHVVVAPRSRHADAA